MYFVVYRRDFVNESEAESVNSRVGLRKQLAELRAVFQSNSNAQLFVALEITVGRVVASECLFRVHRRRLHVFEWTFATRRAIAWR